MKDLIVDINENLRSSVEDMMVNISVNKLTI